MSNSEKPAFRLATIVVDRLVKEGVLRSERRDNLIERISMGSIKEPDWGLEIDLAIAKETQP